MKLAARNQIIAYVLILAAGSLRAASPETLPEPPALRSSSVMQRSSQFSQPSSTNILDSTDDGQMHFDHGDLIDEPGGCDGGPAYPYTTSQWWRNGCWYLDVDFVVWNRTRPRKQERLHVLGLDTSNNGFEIERTLNKEGHNLPLEPGARSDFGIHARSRPRQSRP